MPRGFMVCGLAIAAEAIIVGAVNFFVGSWNHIETAGETTPENETCPV